MEAVVHRNPDSDPPGAAWAARARRWWPFGGRAAAQRDTQDPSTGLLTAPALFSRCEPLLRAGNRPLTVALLELGDLREVREIYGQRVRRAVIRQWARRLRAAAGARGLVARTGPEQFLLVLPGADTAQAEAALGRGLGSPPRLEFDPRGLELVLVPDVLVETLGEQELSLAAVHARMASALAAHREAERRRQHYLELERARHSRPMPLRPLARRA